MNNAQDTPLDTLNKTLITISVMLVAVIEVLDMTIVNVALPQMMGQLGANSDQITWVLTSYVVSSAILMPMTGFLAARVGQKKLLMINVIGFMITSGLCGMSTSLGEIVLFRTLQGVFGASLVPMSQTILRNTFPIEKQAKAMAIWGIGIMVAPVLGPTVGGYITDAASWRWVFYINVPFCIMAAIMIIFCIQETPREHSKIDWLGIMLLVIGVGSLQIFLDRGNTSNWFDSKMITLLAVMAFAGLGMFISRGRRLKEKNIINFSLFRDRNFCLCTIMLAIYCMGALGILTLRPLMMEHLIGYTAKTAGLAMAPSGIASAFGMIIASMLMKHISPKIILIAGVLLSMAASYTMATQSLLTMSFEVLQIQSLFLGLGMGFVFLIISSVSLSTLRGREMADGAGLFSFGRNLGVSIGISLLSTLVTRATQTNWNQLSEHVYSGNSALNVWLQAHNATLQNPQTIARLGELVANQANLIAFSDAYWITAIGFTALIPLAFFLKPPKALTMGAGH
ncbi:MAG: MFS transporter [Gammaproteobacteria bacterium CG11_big_fil_rev_8_21_14_0_20_46_22]|nr:MAG: MFS transporter [Gammaproteobacteria bacterium CG12_big_fil_rev_8_21_14_0_65_46_12]PIR10649.1 MAG: MFS transporter [Gammaproteobacteria bacterium CG11_big_fil_rev_8_21_14_0_20_46_22]